MSHRAKSTRLSSAGDITSFVIGQSTPAAARLRLSLIPTMSISALLLPFDPSGQPRAVCGIEAQNLWISTPSGEKPPKVGTTRTFFNTPWGKTTTISSLGDKFAAKKGNERRELVRKAIGAGIKDLKAFDGLKEVLVDALADPHAAGMDLS